MPDALDPQIREFAGRLRRLVDRSGLSIADVADRTGYGKTSWERYLDGRLLAPKGAVVALAEVTGTDPVHLTTLWELAERAWSRSETRHDVTMEAIRISRSRTAPGGAGPAGGAAPAVPPLPAQRTAAESPDALSGTSRTGPSHGGAPGGNSWGLAGYRGPSPATRRPPRGGPGGAGTAGGPGHGAPGAPAPAGPPRGPGRGGWAGGGGRRPVMFLAGAVGALIAVAGAFLLLDGGGDQAGEGARAAASPGPSTRPRLPDGVRCGGDQCTGEDAETMGCSSGGLVTTARQITVGTAVVEVRYSAACGAAWGRVTQAAQGDEVEVTAGGSRQTGAVTEAGDTLAYTPMVAVRKAGDAVVCVTLASGQRGCTG
ncbi:hypothetical protein TU94_20050 [Streptomyces cyaneogriseus subsp. noncyanogenus]|uniref:HTH cro/C1-type domain-containing protein n=1 Tax=Streptomyces cyaneogriseus subsp. noncyanogenus TaxID=477245 RepID=A0A0C5FTQ9_9ACTN|nr:XRE family transcriptional regulator [Streptomyces cyaneogriseus]AJP03432.1 hypothetical protein TU94_20050 [Streptomyces cyaneogriseus subsp. noncyanogenus]